MKTCCGYSREELLGRHTADFSAAAPEDGFPHFPAFMEELLSLGVVENHEAHWRKKDGSLVLVEIKATLLKNSGDAVIGAVSAVRDISEREKTEKALRDSEERFRVLAESLPEGIIAIDSRGQHRVLEHGGAESFRLYPGRSSGPAFDHAGARALQAGRTGKAQAAAKAGHRAFKGRILHGLGRRKDGSEFADEISRAFGPQGRACTISPSSAI